MDGELDLPSVGCDLGHDERERSLGELDEGAAIVPASQQDFAGNFGRLARCAPNGLAFAHGPARLLEINRGHGGEGIAAGGEEEQR